MIIRKSKLKDAEEISTLYLEIWKAHSSLGEFWLPNFASDKMKTFGELIKKENIQKKLLKDAKQTIKDNNSFLFVAEENNKILGYIYFYIEKNISWFKIKKYGFLDEICVSPKYRGKGIAKSLLSFVQKYLKNKGINYILLKTSLDNELAKKTWQAYGFKEQMILWVKKF